MKKTIKKVLRPYVYTPRIWLKQWKVRNLAQASRSKRFDKRNADGSLSYTSLIIDAKKKKRHNHI